MAGLTRYLSVQVTEDLTRRMVFVAGPRQVGKTTFAVAAGRPRGLPQLGRAGGP